MDANMKVTIVEDMTAADELTGTVESLRGLCHVFNAVNEAYGSDVMPEYAYIENQLWTVLEALDGFTVRLDVKGGTR